MTIKFDYNVDADNLRSGLPDVFIEVRATVDEYNILTFDPPEYDTSDVINEEKMYRQITQLAWKRYHQAMDAITEKARRVVEGGKILKAIPENDQPVYEYKRNLLLQIILLIIVLFQITH